MLGFAGKKKRSKNIIQRHFKDISKTPENFFTSYTSY